MLAHVCEEVMEMVEQMKKGQGLKKLVAGIEQSDPRYLVTKLTLCLAKLQSVTKWSLKEIFDRVSNFIEMLDEMPNAVADLNAGEEEKKIYAKPKSKKAPKEKQLVEPAPLIVLKVPKRKTPQKPKPAKKVQAAKKPVPKKPVPKKTKPVQTKEKTVSARDHKIVLGALQLLHLDGEAHGGSPFNAIQSRLSLLGFHPSRGVILTTLQQLRKEGLIEAIGAGRWAPTAKGMDA